MNPSQLPGPADSLHQPTGLESTPDMSPQMKNDLAYQKRRVAQSAAKARTTARNPGYPTAQDKRISTANAKIKRRLAESTRAKAPAKRPPASSHSLVAQMMAGNPAAMAMMGKMIGHGGGPRARTR